MSAPLASSTPPRRADFVTRSAKATAPDPDEERQRERDAESRAHCAAAVVMSGQPNLEQLVATLDQAAGAGTAARVLAELGGADLRAKRLAVKRALQFHRDREHKKARAANAAPAASDTPVGDVSLLRARIAALEGQLASKAAAAPIKQLASELSKSGIELIPDVALPEATDPRYQIRLRERNRRNAMVDQAVARLTAGLDLTNEIRLEATLLELERESDPVKKYKLASKATELRRQ